MKADRALVVAATATDFFTCEATILDPTIEGLYDIKLFFPKACELRSATEYLASSELSSSSSSSSSSSDCYPTMHDLEVSCSSSESMLSMSDRSLGFIRLINVLDILLFCCFGMCESLNLIPPPIELLLGRWFLCVLTNLVLRSLHCLI